LVYMARYSLKRYRSVLLGLPLPRYDIDRSPLSPGGHGHYPFTIMAEKYCIKDSMFTDHTDFSDTMLRFDVLCDPSPAAPRGNNTQWTLATRVPTVVRALLSASNWPNSIATPARYVRQMSWSVCINVLFERCPHSSCQSDVKRCPRVSN
jgi:hypothetical protein